VLTDMHAIVMKFLRHLFFFWNYMLFILQLFII